MELTIELITQLIAYTNRNSQNKNQLYVPHQALELTFINEGLQIRKDIIPDEILSDPSKPHTIIKYQINNYGKLSLVTFDNGSKKIHYDMQNLPNDLKRKFNGTITHLKKLMEREKDYNNSKLIGHEIISNGELIENYNGYEKYQLHFSLNDSIILGECKTLTFDPDLLHDLRLEEINQERIHKIKFLDEAVYEIIEHGKTKFKHRGSHYRYPKETTILMQKIVNSIYQS